MASAQPSHGGPEVLGHGAAGNKVALWWLRHYETIINFWTGFSWVWVIGLLLYAFSGQLNVKQALLLILFIGVIGNAGAYLGLRTLSGYLKLLKDGPEKEEAHKLMTKIISRRMATMR